MNPSIDKALTGVSGYLELYMPEDALQTLDALPADLGDYPDVLTKRVAALMAGKRWAEATTLARSLTEFMAEEPDYWVWWAYAKRRAESVEAAEAILGEALDEHPEVAVIHYNLACYASVQGRFEEARRKLDHAAELDPEAPEPAALDAPRLRSRQPGSMHSWS